MGSLLGWRADRSARQHAIETIAWNVLAVVVLLAIRPYHRAGTSPRAPIRLRCRSPSSLMSLALADLATAVAKETGGLRPRTWFDVLLGLVMVGFVALQFYVKYSRGGWPDVWYLFMPCHVYTTMLALCLLLRDRRWVNRIFTIVVVYTAWSPILALVFPDFSDQIYRTEHANCVRGSGAALPGALRALALRFLGLCGVLLAALTLFAPCVRGLCSVREAGVHHPPHCHHCCAVLHGHAARPLPAPAQVLLLARLGTDGHPVRCGETGTPYRVDS